MILLTLTLGSRNYFLLESPSFQMIAWCTRRFWRYSPMFFPRPWCPSPLQFPTIDKSPWIATYTCRPYLHFQLLLLLQDTLKYFAIFRESFALAALQLLFRLNTPTNNSSHLSGIRSSLVDHMSHKILWIQFNLPKILCSLVLSKVLSACIMVKSICLTIFIDILCHCHPEPIDSLCCVARNHQSNPEI